MLRDGVEKVRVTQHTNGCLACFVYATKALKVSRRANLPDTQCSRQLPMVMRR
jgi:hypothetical protein